MEKEWIFLRKIDHDPTEKADWRIYENKLELKSDAQDPILLEPFVNLIGEAQTKHVPYILIGLRKGFWLNQEWYYYFYDSSFTESSKGTNFWFYLSEKNNWGKNPLTNISFDVVEIFVAGDDGKLTFFNQIDKDLAFAYPPEEWWEYLLKFSEDLKKPGYGHMLIARLFSKKAQKSPLSDVDIENLRNRRLSIKNELTTASENCKLELSNEIERINNEIKKLSKEKFGYEGQIAFRYAYLWYDWALTHFPSGSPEYNQAQHERDNIPCKPDILLEKPQDHSLLQNFQNLTRALQYLSIKIH